MNNVLENKKVKHICERTGKETVFTAWNYAQNRGRYRFQWLRDGSMTLEESVNQDNEYAKTWGTKVRYEIVEDSK